MFLLLVTELFLMVNSRAKNLCSRRFWEVVTMGEWCFLPYDFVTAIGINNEVLSHLAMSWRTSTRWPEQVSTTASLRALDQPAAGIPG